MPELATEEPVRVAYSHARRLGLTRDDAYECALDFRLHLLRCENPQIDNEAWLHRCAKNFACNSIRSKIRRMQRERDYEANSLSRQIPLSVTALREAGPRTITLRKSLLIQLSEALKSFTHEQQALFEEFHVRQRTFAEISELTGRNAHSLAQSLYNIHKRLARTLLAQGWTAEEARQLYCFSQLPATVRPRS